MAKRTHLWGEGVAIGVLGNFVCFLVATSIAYLKHEGSEWVSPLLFGALTWFLTMGIWLVFRLLPRLPKKQIRLSDKNLQTVLRGWLDDIGLKVQTTHDSDSEFAFIVTTDGGKVITVRRTHTSPEHLTFRALFKEDAQNEAFEDFSVNEKARARLAIQLELARAVMGYNTKDVLKEFVLFRTLPISNGLSVEDVANTLWEVEAALTAVFLVGAQELLSKKPYGVSALTRRE